MEIEKSKIIQAPAPLVFEVASDVERLPSWIPTAQQASADDANHVHLEGETREGHYEADGLFRARPEQLRLEWGSERTGEYAGWLQVEHQSNGSASEVVIHLSFLDELDEEYRAARLQGVERELEESLDRLANQVAATG